ncbi:MAG: ABC transporter ATP-binding protein [Bacillota bacterium]|nr:ABC transporter ATP-binding protein [Bacillota bacterium]
MVIETVDITKYYGKKLGCRNVCISVDKGQIFGLLGPNGAGKSTFVKMLVGLIHPTSGKGFLLGKPIGDINTRKKIGYLPENFKYQEWMTGADLLSFHASLYKLDKRLSHERIEDVLHLVKLSGNERYKISTYSKGMQQRIGLACALLPEPDLLFLDEPTSALDPIGRKEVRDIMLELRSHGKTVLLNSHLLSEVETVCDSIAIINKGEIVKQGNTDEILEGKLVLEAVVEGINSSIINSLKKYDSELIINNNKITLSIESKDNVHEIACMIVENGGRLYGLTPRRESLENVFINLVEGGDQV